MVLAGRNVAIESAAQLRIAHIGTVHPNLRHVEALRRDELTIKPNSSLTRRYWRDRHRRHPWGLGTTIRREYKPCKRKQCQTAAASEIRNRHQILRAGALLRGQLPPLKERPAISARPVSAGIAQA